MIVRAATLSLAAGLLAAATAIAQAPGGRPRPGAGPPPVTWRGLVPGVTADAEVREVLGAPAREAKWYAWKMLYPAAGRPGFFDAVHLQSGGPGGTVGCIEAVSVPEGLEDREAVLRRLGDPAFEIVWPSGQRLLDYSEQGVRFTFDAGGRTIGMASFPHGWRRDLLGGRRLVDLSGLRQGPQPRPEAAVDPDLEVGAAEIEITPDPTFLPRRFTVHDPLKARCAVFVRGETVLAIVGADLFGMMWSEIRPVQERLAERGIGQVIVAMSHDHAAPDGIGIYGFYPKDWVEDIQDRLVEVVLRAHAGRRRARSLWLGAEDLPLTGARVAGFSRNARNPGLVDPQLAVLQARDAQNRPIVTLVHFACHVEGLEKGTAEISADFPGYLCERLRERTGAPAVFLNGALGGMVSGDTAARTHDEARAVGERLARAALDVLSRAIPSPSADFAIDRREVLVPVDNPRFRAFAMLARGRRPLREGSLATEMWHVRLGEAELLTVPGELLPELSLPILERMAGFPRMIVGLANDELGYVLPKSDFRPDEYEESMSMGPRTGGVILRAAVDLLGR